MQITVKLKLKSPIELGNFQRKYSNVVRFAFNRALEGMSKFDIFNLIPSLNNVDELDRSWKEQAVKDGFGKAQAVLGKYRESQDPSTLKVIFGGKRLFYQRLRKEITRDEYLSQRKFFPVTCEGSKADSHGNRKFKFDFISFEGTVMTDKGKISFACHRTSKRNLSMLLALQEMIERKECGMTCRITNEDFYIVFDTNKLPKEISYRKDKDRTMAIDINPNYIGLSVIDGNDILLRRCYDLSAVKGRNKKKHELTEIAIEIKHLCAQYKISLVGYEKVEMQPKNHGKGRRFNRLVNNEWCREHFLTSLRKHLSLIGCKTQEIAPQYSSIIGCLMYPDETDSVAASLELNRRLRKFKAIYIDKTEAKSPVLYPEFREEYMNRWKEEGDSISLKEGWRDVFRWIKESKSSYRFLYPDYVKQPGVAVLRFKSRASKVTYVTNGDKSPYLN